MHGLRQHRVWRFIVALAGVAAISASLWLLQRWFAPANLLLCYVLLVLLTAIHLGRSAAALASFVAFLAYNFLFVSPRYTLTVEQPQDVIELGVFLGISLLVGTLAAHERTLAATAARRADHMAALYAISQQMHTPIDDTQGATALAMTVGRVLHAAGVEVMLASHADRPALSGCAGICEGTPDRVVEIASGGQHWGELRIWGLAPALTEELEITPFIITLANQIAVVAERAHIASVALHTQAIHEADRLKSALLSSVSHDLRTPLAAIKGAASNLLDTSVDWDRATQRVFAETIVIEADRLNRLMRNLLEMSRLEAGTVRRQRALIELGDVIVPTVQRLRSLLVEHPIEMEFAPELPSVLMDALQIELVLTNLLENAAKFAPAGTPILVTAREIEAAVQISVADAGPGIPTDALDRIFDKFYRVAGPEHGPGGSGLGLTICSGIVAAHGGRIWAEHRPGGGAILNFTLPVEAESPRSAVLPTETASHV